MIPAAETLGFIPETKMKINKYIQPNRNECSSFKCASLLSLRFKIQNKAQKIELPIASKIPNVLRYSSSDLPKIPTTRRKPQKLINIPVRSFSVIFFFSSIAEKIVRTIAHE